MSGEDQSPRAAILRGGLRVIEPFYATAMRLRNACYDRGIFTAHDLGRPTISVGNITTGGTGKTPVVQWLASQLRTRGHRPAILLRGYRSTSDRPSDEAMLLEQTLNTGEQVKIPVMPNPSRVAGAATVLTDCPEVSHFILDDGFQHRRAKRDFNLVLISATQPFGFGHVLPRGLLREPLSGLARADAFLITRASLVSKEAFLEIEGSLRSRHPNIPVFRCDHVQRTIWMPGSGEMVPITELTGRRVFLTAGIGDPAGFEHHLTGTFQLTGARADIVGKRWWADHHAYTSADMDWLLAAAKSAGAGMLLTTGKDWVKMRPLGFVLPVGVVNLEIEFAQGDELGLMERIDACR